MRVSDPHLSVLLSIFSLGLGNQHPFLKTLDLKCCGALLTMLSDFIDTFIQVCFGKDVHR